MKTISYVGPDSHFNGWDHDTTPAREFTIGPGQTLSVNDATAAALAENHPGDFEIDGKLAGHHPTPAPAEPVDEPVTLEELLKGTRDQLNQLATIAGIDAPEKLKDKQAVADAILEHAPSQAAA